MDAINNKIDGLEDKFKELQEQVNRETCSSGSDSTPVQRKRKSPLGLQVAM